jgi:hypothetical protein
MPSTWWCRLARKSSRRLIAVAIAVSGAYGLAACGVAASRPSDAALTSAYLSAREVRERAVEKELVVSRSAIERYVTRADARCPGIVARAPRSREFGELNYEAFLAVAVTMERANSRTIARFVHIAGHLRWAGRRLTLLVRRLVEEEGHLAGLVPPDLCGELAEWARSGYRTIPPTARRFQEDANVLARIRAATSSEQAPSGKLVGCQRVGPHGRVICSVRGSQEHPVEENDNKSPTESTSAVVWKLLKPYEYGEQQKMARDTEQLEAHLKTETDEVLTSSMSALAHSLGLNPAVVPLVLEDIRNI